MEPLNYRVRVGDVMLQKQMKKQLMPPIYVQLVKINLLNA